MSFNEKADALPAYNCGDQTQADVAYQLKITRNRSLHKHVSGVPRFSGAIDSERDVVIIPTNASNREISALFWRRIKTRYPAIVTDDNQASFTKGFNATYYHVTGSGEVIVTSTNQEDYVSNRDNAEAIFQLLRQDGIKVIRLDLHSGPSVATDPPNIKSSASKPNYNTPRGHKHRCVVQ